MEDKFDIGFTAALATKEKQIQQNYRPVIGVHKWFARRPGTVFRNLILAEFDAKESLEKDYWLAHTFEGVIADPFMGGGTPLFEANRLGFSVVGADINPMAFWVVRQSLASLDIDGFAREAEAVIRDIEREVGRYFVTECGSCGKPARVKYFLWVKTQCCPECGTANDLFPGYLLAEAVRHPKHVIACGHCGHLNECDDQPRGEDPDACSACGKAIHVDGPAKRNHICCRKCSHVFRYPESRPTHPPRHRMWAIEYHCDTCKANHKGRFFKGVDAADLSKFREATRRLMRIEDDLFIPTDAIPEGDETTRLHRWGYRRYREMFNERQLLGLGLLLKRIRGIKETSYRHAMLTVFSDFLRYQNMLARYDTYALKCQDIFSVHGFPVGLVQCEDNLLGIPRVGSGSFRHFVEKYKRAKEYCKHPFETRNEGGRKKIVPVCGERLEGNFVDQFPKRTGRQAWIACRSAEGVELPLRSLDGVFTDPPYFDNVQYAELMDFCYVWLRAALAGECEAFRPMTTRAQGELTGNETMGRGLDHFTEGLSRIFVHYARALKVGAPFVFTYHHNDPQAYVPVVVAILDAGLDCTATLPAPAEMGASLHIARSNSSVLDSVFVCRKVAAAGISIPITNHVQEDLAVLRRAGLKPTEGDFRCLLAGHIARVAINRLKKRWSRRRSLSARMAGARRMLVAISEEIGGEKLIAESLTVKRCAQRRA